MKKTIKTLTLIFLAAAMLSVGLCFMLKDLGIKGFRKDVYVAFSKEKMASDNALYSLSNDLSDFHSRYDEYNTHTYFSVLNTKEKLIYRIFEYALDNQYPYILLDETLLVGIDHSPTDILSFLSLDSPLVEQNLATDTETFSVSNTQLFGLHRKEVSGLLLHVRIFTNGSLVFKEKAIQAAKDIVKNIPQASLISQKETGEYLYKYLRDNVTYKLYGEGQERNYLYDALVEHVTQCDGLANAYSLLCNMAGLPCVEKKYLLGDGDGHTWNSIFLDDSWYNVDVTMDSKSASIERDYGILFNFGFSDDLLSVPHLWNNLLPIECNQSFFEIDCAFNTEKDHNLSNAICKAFKTDKSYVIITIKESPLNDGWAKTVCNDLGFDLLMLWKNGTNQNMYVLIKNKR